MGVIRDDTEPETDAPDAAQAEPEPPAVVDPFLHQYDTDLYEMDTETVNQVLTGIIAVANLLK